MAKLSIVFYGLLAAVGLIINGVRGVTLVPLAGVPGRLLPGIAAALVAAAALVGLSAYAANRFEWARNLEAVFRQALGPLRRGEVFVVALASGIGEEVFFRGALQPALASFLRSDVLGLLAATAVFTALHTARGRELAAWTAFAFVGGLILGLLFLGSGSVLPPILVHVVVNDTNLARITRPIRSSPD